jgi:hypothetical protein
MHPYFSQNFQDTQPKFPTKKQLLFIRFIDFFEPDHDFNLNDELVFTVRFSNSSTIREDQNSAIPIYVYPSLNMPPYEEVSKVELKGISFPNLQDKINNRFGSAATGKNHVCFALDIPEFNGRIHSSVNQLQNTFAIIYYDSTDGTAGTVKPLKGIDFEQKIYIPPQPIKRMNKFTIKFRNSDGEIIRIGDLINLDDVNNAKNILHQITLLFEFTIKA